MKMSFLIFLLVGFHTALLAQDEVPEKLQMYRDSGRYYFNKDLEKSKHFYLKALEFSKENNRSRDAALSYAYVSYLAKREGNYKESLSNLFKALQLNEQNKDSVLIALNYFDIAGVKRYLEEYQSALDYYNKAIAIHLKNQDTINLAQAYNMSGIVERKLGRFKNAKADYNKAFKLFEIKDRPKGILRAKSNLARLYIDLENYNKSLSIYFELLKTVKDSGNELNLETFYGNIALNYEKLKEYNKSVVYLDSAIAVCSKMGYKDRLSINLLYRSNNYKALNIYNKALEDYHLHKTYYDSVHNIESAKKIKEIELKHQFFTEKLQDSLQFDSEKQLLQVEAKNQETQKWLYALLFGITILGLLTLILFYQKRRKLNKESLEKEVLEKELLNEKLAFIQHRVEQLKVDNKMRLDYKKELLHKIKTLKLKQNTTSVQEYQSLITDLHTQINTETRLDALSQNAIATDIDFENKLYKLYPELTKSEREICSLIQMNLSLKEIMNIRNSSMASIKSSRYRIRKKLNIPKGQELEFFIKKVAR